ncbi:hypothetical protein FRC05_003271 [Tulasnella sp. 425]|nr:hypothetical protein FRC05_003271 [Tulasnella sp. 425]
MSDQTPNYLGLASAELILSEIRPTKIKPETLLAVNIIVDEILWLILNAARSLATERLNRDGLMKILPTSLGKDALLEAEVELKAYWDRTDPVDRGCTIEHNSKLSEFPLQAAFELMRAKCEVYSTLGDAEEDIEEEDRLQNQMMLASSGPPRASAVAPAALYITASLEHILTNVAKVVARDSSRTTAHVQDLYVALCEDDSIYPLFKRMKVKEQLEAQTKAAAKPRRSRSINTHQQNGRGSPNSTLRGSTSSPQPRPSDAVSVGTNKVARTSEESSGTSGPSATSPPRKSGEKSRLKMFGSRGGGGGNSTDQDYYSSKHQRSDSSMSDTTRRTAAGLSDSADEYHHDVFAKEKSQRNGRSSSVSSVNPPPPTTPDLKVPIPSSAPSSAQPSFKLANKGSRSNLVARPPQTVESIEEDEDEEGFAAGSPSVSGGTGSARQPPGVNKPRSRTQSLAQFLQEAPPWEKDAATLESVAMGGSGAMSVPNTAVPKIVTGRARSQTTGSGGTSPMSTAPSTAVGPSTPSSAAPQNVRKKTSGYLSPLATAPPPSAFRPVPKVGPVPDGSRRGPAKNIEDIDLDDLMADDDDETSSVNTAAASTVSQPRKGALGGRKNSLTGGSAVSASTREMIDFLSEGPPPSPPATSPKAPVKEVQPTKSKGSGRFGRMISKLARSSSVEAMSIDKKKASSSVEDVSSSRQTSSQGSHKTSSAAPLPQWTRPTPPPPPPVIPAAQPAAAVAPSPTTPTQTQSGNAPAVVRPRAGSSARKPAPPFPTTAPSPLATTTIAEQAQPFASASPVITPTRSRLSSMRSRPNTAPGSAVASLAEISATPPAEEETPTQDAPPVPVAAEAPTMVHTESTTSTSSSSEPTTRSLSDKSVGTDAVEAEPSIPAPVKEVVAPPPVPAVPAGSVFVDAERAQQMRQMVARATSVGECQVLVEMFLAQWGVPRTAEEQDEPEQEETNKELKAEEEAHGPPLVETLLGDTTACEANNDDNQTDDAHDVPRTPKTPTDVILHSEEPSTTSTAAEPYSADLYQKNLDSNMLSSVSHPIIAA